MFKPPHNACRGSASTILAVLRQAGISTSLDDFGCGYSNLAYLVRLPINTLKIDKALVWALGNEPNAVAIIRAVITLAHAVGMATVAEGVETEQQRGRSPGRAAM
ncbi:EAL domain-containing protein [Paraburkholderia sp. GV068]|uniref:EAL domain-containing protein n=1 Tax=Paraburkholderia TaxID=1822464 RepID=UPI000D45CA9A|nr:MULTISPECIES: EAL domain-containing protein [unclassified Paraburkholderia]PTQ99106.1 EAL domain-containing protein [Paraburkholderia sp. GV072]PUB04598.1 EAL domain-containing protein [Paraburkholderia sp. GV068]